MRPVVSAFRRTFKTLGARISVAIVLLFAVITWPLDAQQEQSPTFRVNNPTVSVDVVVRDQSGAGYTGVDHGMIDFAQIRRVPEFGIGHVAAERLNRAVQLQLAQSIRISVDEEESRSAFACKEFGCGPADAGCGSSDEC